MLRFEVAVEDQDTASGSRRHFDIDDYDQVWFFGDWPGVVANNPSISDDVIGSAEYNPLDNAELRIVAEWMISVAVSLRPATLATGSVDVPRIRGPDYARWTRANRCRRLLTTNETLVHGPGLEDAGGYRQPQQITPVLQEAPLANRVRRSPHPPVRKRRVMNASRIHARGRSVRGRRGRLTDALDIPGYERDEYPSATGIYDGGGNF